ncbi:hypothetical protein [Methanococcoides methylutens]|uniref:hypothetical protein n=1 Tax=Methanococcoides methylutens TaxID=2226 RepID=UPI00064F2CBF|nr:hypothetical protein [Methanococcoides methylutens]
MEYNESKVHTTTKTSELIKIKSTKLNKEQIRLLDSLKVIYGYNDSEALRWCVDEVLYNDGEELLKKAQLILAVRDTDKNHR